MSYNSNYGLDGPYYNCTYPDVPASIKYETEAKALLVQAYNQEERHATKAEVMQEALIKAILAVAAAIREKT